MVVTITLNDSNNPPGKRADAEVHFTDGVLAGLKLVGFAVWERKGGNGFSVTFPARTYVVGGERRSYTLLRPIADYASQEPIRALILEAFAEALGKRGTDGDAEVPVLLSENGVV
jgi:hypothetical protein